MLPEPVSAALRVGTSTASTAPGLSPCSTPIIVPRRRETLPSDEGMIPELTAWAMLDLGVKGFDEVETVSTIEESLVFALPPELRKDMKAAAAQ